MKMQFEMWSAFHFFMMIFPFVLGFVLYKITRDKEFTVKRKVALVMGIMLIFILASRQIYIFNRDGGLNPEIFPFQVCHFASFTLFVVAINKNHRVIGAIAWCLNFPAGLVSIIFADGLENYSNVLNIQGIAYIAGHMLIVAMGLYLLLTEMILIERRTLLKSYKILVPLYFLSVIVNNWFTKIFGEESNYFYTYAPEWGTPLEDLYNLGSNINVLGITFNLVYLISLAIVGALGMYLMYLLSKLRYIRRNSKLQDTS